MSINIQRNENELVVEDSESGAGFTVSGGVAEWQGLSDGDLAAYINDRADAANVAIDVTESDIPTTHDDELRQAIADASNLSELKSALAGDSLPVQAQGRRR